MNNQLITYESAQHNPVVEGIIQKRDAEIKEQVQKKATHFALRNLPLATGDILEHYIGEFRASYEKLAAEVFHLLQPATHFPEAKIDGDYFRRKSADLELEIDAKEKKNNSDKAFLGDYDFHAIPKRVGWTLGVTFMITIAETLYNTKAFELIGENLLFALFLSAFLSFTVFLFSHLVPIWYKSAVSTLRRRLIIVVSAMMAISVFTALAIFRSQYLASHGVIVSPIYFIVINIFFFVVSTLISYYFLPSYQEIKIIWQSANAIR